MAFDMTGGYNAINAINALHKKKDERLLRYLLMLNTYRGNLQAVEAVLKKGIPIDYAEPSTGLSPLHVAVGRNNLAMTQFLVEKGANFKADRLGRWPSVIAAVCEVDENLCDFIVEAEAAATQATSR